MGRLEEMTRYLRSSFLQNVLALLLNISLFFLKSIKIFFHGLFHSNQRDKFNPVYPSLWMENISPSCTFDFSLDPPQEILDTKRLPDEPHDAAYESEHFPQGHVAPNTQSR